MNAYRPISLSSYRFNSMGGLSDSGLYGQPSIYSSMYSSYNPGLGSSYMPASYNYYNPYSLSSTNIPSFGSSSYIPSSSYQTDIYRPNILNYSYPTTNIKNSSNIDELDIEFAKMDAANYLPSNPNLASDKFVNNVRNNRRPNNNNNQNIPSLPPPMPQYSQQQQHQLFNNQSQNQTNFNNRSNPEFNNNGFNNNFQNSRNPNNQIQNTNMNRPRPDMNQQIFNNSNNNSRGNILEPRLNEKNFPYMNTSRNITAPANINRPPPPKNTNNSINFNGNNNNFNHRVLDIDLDIDRNNNNNNNNQFGNPNGRYQLKPIDTSRKPPAPFNGQRLRNNNDKNNEETDDEYYVLNENGRLTKSRLAKQSKNPNNIHDSLYLLSKKEESGIKL